MEPKKVKKTRQAYEKPVLRTIELTAEEVLGVGCKTSFGDSRGVAGHGCITGFCSSRTGS
jgi:hypothetical protein